MLYIKDELHSKQSEIDLNKRRIETAFKEIEKFQLEIEKLEAESSKLKDVLEYVENYSKNVDAKCGGDCNGCGCAEATPVQVVANKSFLKFKDWRDIMATPRTVLEDYLRQEMDLTGINLGDESLSQVRIRVAEYHDIRHPFETLDPQ